MFSTIICVYILYKYKTKVKNINQSSVLTIGNQTRPIAYQVQAVLLNVCRPIICTYLTKLIFFSNNLLLQVELHARACTHAHTYITINASSLYVINLTIIATPTILKLLGIGLYFKVSSNGYGNTNLNLNLLFWRRNSVWNEKLVNLRSRASSSPLYFPPVGGDVVIPTDASQYVLCIDYSVPLAV